MEEGLGYYLSIAIVFLILMSCVGGVNVIERLSLTQDSRSELHLVMQFMVDKIPVR